MKSSPVTEIETLVRERKARAATDRIRKFLKTPAAKGDFKSLIQACDWYRRLGLFREAFLLVSDALAEPLPVAKDLSTRQVRGRKILWAARLLNLLGASSQALVLARKLDGHDAESHQVLGTIFLGNFEYESALSHLEKMTDFDAEPQSYRSSINRLGLADALAGLSRFDDAIKIASEIAQTRREVSERLLQGIALEAWGEYLARAGRYKEALPLFERAREYFPAGDRTPDRAFLDKWEGYVRCKLGDRERGLSMLREAAGILRELALRPEAWLDVYRLLFELSELRAEEVSRLTHYPGLAPGLSRYFAKAKLRFGSEDAELSLDLDADEFTEKGKRFLGVSQELKLLGALRVVEDWGLSLERAKGVIWPEEVYAYPLLEARLHKLIARLRSRYDIEVEVRGRSMFLGPEALSRVSVTLGAKDARPSFLEARHEFVAKDLGTHYEISRSQGAVQLASWRERGWITAVGKGASLRYRVSR